MRKNQQKKIREFYDEGFSISELALMYEVSEYRIKKVLEEQEDGV